MSTEQTRKASCSCLHCSFLNEIALHSIKLIWDEATYVNENGASIKIMHSGSEFIDESNPQVPSIIVKNSQIEDIIVPRQMTEYYCRGWQVHSLFPDQAANKKELQAISQKYIGKTVQILLPLELEGTVNEYIFRFMVKDFIIR